MLLLVLVCARLLVISQGARDRRPVNLERLCCAESLRSAWARVVVCRVNGLLAAEILRAVFGLASAGLTDSRSSVLDNKIFFQSVLKSAMS